MRFVQEIIFLFKETCLIFFTTLFIYCGPFLVGVHVCFGTQCSKSFKALAMAHE